jgi:hypothetical protein
LFTTTVMELGSSRAEYAGAAGAASTTGVLGVGVGEGVGLGVREVALLAVKDGVGMGAVPQPDKSNVPTTSTLKLAREEDIIASE